MMGRYRVAAAWGETRNSGLRRLGALAVAMGLGVGLGGCSFALPSLLGEPETTNSTKVSFRSPLSTDLGAEDWRRAKGALAVALDPQGSGASVSWDNPDSGIKGTFVPVGTPFVQSDQVCRAFIATISGNASSSLQGTACRASAEEWDIRGVKPWRKPD